jgi:hypothetical protein
MEKALSLAGMSFRRIWADEAESVALQPNRLDPVAGSHSAAAALVRCSSSEAVRTEQIRNKSIESICSPAGFSKCYLHY